MEQNIDKIEFCDLSDEELVGLSQGKSYEALEELMSRYKNLVNARAKSFYMPGADKDDIIQEGMIGLYKAIMDFDKSKTPYFRTFAAACVKNNIITAVKSATTKKNSPLNFYVSLTKGSYDGEEEPLLDVVAVDKVNDPEAIVIDRENVDGIEYAINKALSELELTVLYEYLSGKSYQDIAKTIGKDTKTVDNALQRVKKKLENELNIK